MKIKESEYKAGYYNDKHRLAEAAFADRIRHAWTCDVKVVPMRYICDFALIRNGTPVGWCEIKERDFDIGEYSTTVISWHKWIHCTRLATETGLPWILAVRWNNADAFYRWDGKPCPLVWVMAGWRTRKEYGEEFKDRDDDDLWVYIPLEEFTRF